MWRSSSCRRCDWARVVGDRDSSGPSSDALLLAFSTASSNATLPVSMAAARERLGIPSDVVSFVLPPGTTLNKNGAAVYKAVTAVFLAHLYGVPLGAGRCVTIVLTSTVAAFAGAGVPGSSLVTTLIVLNAIGLGPRRRRRHRARRRQSTARSTCAASR